MNIRIDEFASYSSKFGRVARSHTNPTAYHTQPNRRGWMLDPKLHKAITDMGAKYDLTFDQHSLLWHIALSDDTPDDVAALILLRYGR